MTVSTYITNTEVFASIAGLVFLSYCSVKFCLQTEKAVETVKKQATFQENSRFHKIISSWNVKLSDTFEKL